MFIRGFGFEYQIPCNSTERKEYLPNTLIPNNWIFFMIDFNDSFPIMQLYSHSSLSALEVKYISEHLFKYLLVWFLYRSQPKNMGLF